MFPPLASIVLPERVDARAEELCLSGRTMSATSARHRSADELVDGDAAESRTRMGEVATAAAFRVEPAIWVRAIRQPFKPHSRRTA